MSEPDLYLTALPAIRDVILGGSSTYAYDYFFSGTDYSSRSFITVTTASREPEPRVGATTRGTSCFQVTVFGCSGGPPGTEEDPAELLRAG
jgi:hypothetical protein